MKCKVGIVPKPQAPAPDPDGELDRRHFLRRRAQILARRGPRDDAEEAPGIPTFLQSAGSGAEAEREVETDAAEAAGQAVTETPLSDDAVEGSVEAVDTDSLDLDGLDQGVAESGDAEVGTAADAEAEPAESGSEAEAAASPEDEAAELDQDNPGEVLTEQLDEQLEDSRPSAPRLATPPAGMAAVRQQVSSRAQALPRGSITAGTAATREAEFVRERAERQQQAVRDGVEPSAAEAMPPMPAELPNALSSPDNPVPTIQEPLQAASNKTLPDQTPPALVRTPQENLPEMGRRPLPPNVIRQLSTFMEEGPQVSDPSDQARTRLQMQWEALMTSPSVQEGEGVQQPLIDVPPPAQAQVPPENRATLSQALARLLQDPTGEARRMIERARGSAFVGGILNRVEATQNLGSDMVGDFANVFGQQLDSIREQAGIAAEELDQAVQDRRNFLEDERRREEEQLQMSIAREGAAVTAENQAVADAIAGARRGMDEQAEEVQASTGGADRVRAIEGRRDRLLGEVNSFVAGQDATYRRAGETRAAELDTLQRAQISAYRYAIQQDEFQLNQEPGERTQLQIQELVAESRTWLQKKEREVRGQFGKLKTQASTRTQGHRDGINEAGAAARLSIRDWASTELGEETSFWDRLIAMVEDWCGQAKENAEAWETTQNAEHAEVASGYVDMMSQVERAAADGISEQELLQSNQLTDEERAVIQAYFEEPRDPIYAVAVGIRERIYSSRSEELKSRLEGLVLNGSFHWSTLEEIGRAYSGDFDAGNRATRLYGAFNPGITGLGTEEEDVFAALAGLNPVQAKAVREAYHSTYGETLDEALRSEMDTDGERNRARSLLSGNQAVADAAALHMAMEETWLGTGLGTEEDLIFQTLRNKSPEEIQAIVDAYRRDYGRDLGPLLREELNDWATLSDHDADRADALMASDTALADAIAVDQSLHGFSWGYAFNLAYGTEFEAGSRDEFTAVYDTIRSEVSAQATREQWTDAQFQAELQRRVDEVENRYNERYPWRTLEGAVEERFEDGPNRDLVMATLNNNELRAEAARIAIENDSIFYASDDVVIDVVERRYDRALEGVRRDMEPELRRQMEEEIRQRDEAHFRETGQRLTGAEIYEMRQQLEVENERTMETEARRRSQADTARMDEIYQEEYDQSLESAVEDATSGVTGEHALKALEQGGYLSRYQRLDFATRVWGTDEEAARRAMEGATPEEIAEMDELWQENHGGQSMRDGLLGGWTNLGFGELSGDDALDMQVALEGRPMTLEDAERIARLREELAEPSYFFGIEVGGAEHDLIAYRRQQLEENAERLRQPVITEEDRRQRDHILDEFAFNQEAVKSAVEQHRARVSAITDSIANTASMVVAVAVGALITFFTGGTAAPVAAALIASLAGTMTSIGVRMSMLGNRYGWEAMATDVGIGVVDAIVAAATAGIGNRLLGLRQAAGVVASSATRSGIRGSIQNIQRRLGAMLARLGDVGPLARKMPSSRLLSQMHQRAGYQRLLAMGVSESVENAVGALPTAVVSNMIDDRNWEGGFQLGNVLTGVATEVGMGIGMGLGMSGGMSAAGSMWRGARTAIRGPDIGTRPRLTTPDQLPLNDTQYQAALREFQDAHPGRSAAEFDAFIQSERQGHLEDFLQRNPGRTEADFDAHLRDDAAIWRAEFEEMNRGRSIDFDAEQGRRSGAALGEAQVEAQARQAVRDELTDALPESRRADLAEIPITRLGDAEFTRATGSLTGDAGVVIRDGQAHVVVREGASPASVRDAVGRLAEITAPGTAGRVADPAAALPRDLRGRVNLETNPDLPPRSVQVHYETHNGLLVGMWVEVGPGARAVDIQMHAGTVRAMRRLQGLSGQIRQVLDRMAQWLGRNPRPAPGTRAFEADLELKKLPGILEERAQALSRADSLEEQLRIAAEIEHLQAQMAEHARFVNSIEAEPGRGFVAAESLTDAQVQQRIAEFETPEVQQALRDLDPAEQSQALMHFGAMRGVMDGAARTGADPAEAMGQFVNTWRQLNALPDADPQITGRLLEQAGTAADGPAHLRELGEFLGRIEGLPDRPDGLTGTLLGQVADATWPGHMLGRINRALDVMHQLPEIHRARAADLLDRLASSATAEHRLADIEAIFRRLHDRVDLEQARLSAFIDRALQHSNPEDFVASRSPLARGSEAVFDDSPFGLDGTITDLGRFELEHRLRMATEALERSHRMDGRGDRAGAAAEIDDVKRILQETSDRFDVEYAELQRYLLGDGSTPRVDDLLPGNIEPESHLAGDLGPQGPSSKVRRDPAQRELDQMLDSLQHPDPNSPSALVERIRSGGPDAEAAQRRINKQSAAPQNAEVVHITPTMLEDALGPMSPPPNGKRQREVLSVPGLGDVIVYRSAATEKNPNPPVRFEAMIPDAVPGKPVVFQFGDGELRVWRGEPTTEHPNGVLMQESVIGPRRDRLGLEDQIFTHGEGEFAGPATERGHVHGAGLGVESPFGIALVPREVNQYLQARGIEAYMRRLRDALPPGAELHYVTSLKRHSGTSRAAEIDYRIDITFQGERMPFAEFQIKIDTDPPGTPREQRLGTRSIEVSPLAPRASSDSGSAHRLMQHMRESIDVPQVLHYGLPRRPLVEPEQMLIYLYDVDPEFVATLAAARGNQLRAHRPPPPNELHIGDWAEELRAIHASDHPPEHVVVDLRGLGLSPSQIRAIVNEVNSLGNVEWQKTLVLF